MTTFEKVLKNHSSEIEDFHDFRDFEEFCRRLGFQADLVEELREEGLFLPDVGRKVWRITDKRNGERVGFFAINYTEENFGYGVVRTQTPPFRVIEIHKMKITKRYERTE